MVGVFVAQAERRKVVLEGVHLASNSLIQAEKRFGGWNLVKKSWMSSFGTKREMGSCAGASRWSLELLVPKECFGMVVDESVWKD